MTENRKKVFSPPKPVRIILTDVSSHLRKNIRSTKMKNKVLRILSVFLAFIIVAAMTMAMASCGTTSGTEAGKQTEAAAVDTEGAAVPDTGSAVTAAPSDEAAVSKTITVDVVDNNGETTTFTLETKTDFLEDALVEAELVEGEETDFGLYITTVNGLKADYNADGSWWAIYQDGEMLMVGAGDTVISDGDHYELVYSK